MRATAGGSRPLNHQVTSMRASTSAAFSLAAVLTPVSAFIGTHPLLGFSNGACSDAHERLHLSIPGLHADDVAQLQPTTGSSELQKAFSGAEQRVYKPYLQPSDGLQQHLNQLLCAGKQDLDALIKMVELDDLTGLVGQERAERLQSLGSDITSHLQALPKSHLVTLSSHPEARTLHTKRQMVAPDAQEIEDALERIMGQDADKLDSSSEVKQEEEEAKDWDLDDWLATASQASDLDAVPTRPAVVYQQESASASSSVSASVSASGYPSSSPSSSSKPSYTSKPLASNAALVEKYAITTPNLIFAIGLFLIVFLPIGLFAVSALSSIETPFGLESKMTGSVMSADKKDQ